MVNNTSLSSQVPGEEEAAAVVVVVAVAEVRAVEQRPRATNRRRLRQRRSAVTSRPHRQRRPQVHLAEVRAHRRQGRNGAGRRIGAAHRTGLPAFGAARMEQKVVEIP